MDNETNTETMGASGALALGAGTIKLAQTLASGTTPLTAALTVKGWLQFEEKRLLLYVRLARLYPSELGGILGTGGQLSLPTPDPEAFGADQSPPSVAQVVASQEAGLTPVHAGANDPMWLQFMQQQECRQESTERVVESAHKELERREKVGQEPSKEPVDATWASRFFNQAQMIRDADLQDAWGRLLAGEVMAPGSYSSRTVQVLEAMNGEDAQLWNRVVAVSLRIWGGTLDAPSILLGFVPDKWFRGQDRLISHLDFIRLSSLGLMSNSAAENFTINKGNHYPDLINMHPYLVTSYSPSGTDPVKLGVRFMTPSGQELARLVTEPTPLERAKEVADIIHSSGGSAAVYDESVAGPLSAVPNAASKVYESLQPDGGAQASKPT